MKEQKVILSLFDRSGNWSRPYRENGYLVIQHDLQLGQCIIDDTVPAAVCDYVEGKPVHGILAAVPCYDFASSGARWWKEKETKPATYNGKNVEFKNTIEESIMLVDIVLMLVDLFNPEFWCIENPKGRIHKLVPELGKWKYHFDPYYFGDPYTKDTYLYGNFNIPKKGQMALPLEGSKIHKLSSSQKNERSETPMGFSYAFYEANKI